MTEDVGIIVVGGGVAGSSAAKAAASLGARVTVLEEHQETGMPTHCPCHLTVSGLEYVGLKIPRGIVENELVGGVFYSPNGTAIEVRHPRTVTIIANRATLDKHIAQQAQDEGANFRFGSSVRELKTWNGRVAGVIAKEGNATIEHDAPLTIDAAGASFSLIKKIGMRIPTRTEMVYGVHAEVDHLKDVQQDMVETYFGSNYAPGFYAWIIPKRDGTGKIGLASNRGHTKTYLNTFMKKHPIASEKLKHSKITRTSYYPIPLSGPIPRTYAPGLLIAGHAASQVKPTTGGGVLFGVLCGRMAGEVAAEAVKTSRINARFLASYEKRWKKALGTDLTAMVRMRRILNRLTDRQIDKVLQSVRRVSTSAELEVLGSLLFSDLQGHGLIRLFRKPKTFITTAISLLSLATG